MRARRCAEEARFLGEQHLQHMITRKNRAPSDQRQRAAQW